MPTKRIEHYANGVLQSFENVTIPQRDVNLDLLLAKIDQALSTNATYLAQPAIPAGAALTTTQLTTAIRIIRNQVDALTRQQNAEMRLMRGALDDVSDT